MSHILPFDTINTNMEPQEFITKAVQQYNKHLDRVRKYNQDHKPELNKKSREYFQKIKSNPEKYEAYKKQKRLQYQKKKDKNLFEEKKDVQEITTKAVEYYQKQLDMVSKYNQDHKPELNAKAREYFQNIKQDEEKYNIYLENKRIKYREQNPFLENCRVKYSKKAIECINFMGEYYGEYIEHAENTGEFKIPETNFSADGYCRTTNTIYEFHGDYWHGNPRRYNLTDIHPTKDLTFDEIYKKTLEREKQIKELGYNMFVIWEMDWNNAIKIIKNIQRKFRLTRQNKLI
jgi:hypothetical protein